MNEDKFLNKLDEELNEFNKETHKMSPIDVNKEIYECEKRYEELNERFSQVLADRDRLIKENAELQNELHKIRSKVEELFMYKRLLYLRLKEEAGDEMSDM